MVYKPSPSRCEGGHSTKCRSLMVANLAENNRRDVEAGHLEKEKGTSEMKWLAVMEIVVDFGDMGAKMDLRQAGARRT